MTQRILVIDDEVDMLMLLRMIIEDNTDYDVETTNSPTEGIKMFREEDYDLVITDLKMPGLDGMDIFDEFKGLKPRTGECKKRERGVEKEVRRRKALVKET
jgi:DNA-binding NtrC family response regulator